MLPEDTKRSRNPIHNKKPLQLAQSSKLIVNNKVFHNKNNEKINISNFNISKVCSFFRVLGLIIAC